MNSNNKTARIVGVLFIIGTVAGILSLVFTGALRDPDYLVNIAANKNQVIMGTFFIVIMAVTLAMVPVVMFPVFKEYNETLALGYVVFRGGLETVSSLGFVVGSLLLVSLSQEYVAAGAPGASCFQHMGPLMKAAGDHTSSILNIVFSLGALMFYYLWYQSRLIPRWLSVWGLLGTVLYLIYGVSSMFDLGWKILMAPLGLNEMVMAVWLIVKGFNSSQIVAEA